MLTFMKECCFINDEDELAKSVNSLINWPK